MVQNVTAVGRTQPVLRHAKGSTVGDRIPVEERITALSRPLWDPSSLLYKGYQAFLIVVFPCMLIITQLLFQQNTLVY
jgi:hypothetical protein